MTYSQRQAEDVATEIRACLEYSKEVTNPRGAYAILKRWYLHVSVLAPNPSRTDMHNFRGYFQALYQREETHTPGLPLATHVDPDQVNYEIPSEAEVEAAVRCLCPYRAGRHTQIRTEHFKQWGREVYSRITWRTLHGWIAGCAW